MESGESRVDHPADQQPTSQHPTEPESAAATPAPSISASQEDLEERRLIRRLQMMMDMVMSVIAQDDNLSVDEASQMVADARRAALNMFPGKELAYNLIYKPRFQRLMRERYRIQ